MEAGLSCSSSQAELPLARTSATRSGVGPKVARRSRCQTGSGPSRFGTASPGATVLEARKIGSVALGRRDAGFAATPAGSVATAFGALPATGVPADLAVVLGWVAGLLAAGFGTVLGATGFSGGHAASPAGAGAPPAGERPPPPPHAQ